MHIRVATSEDSAALARQLSELGEGPRGEPTPDRRLLILELCRTDDRFQLFTAHNSRQVLGYGVLRLDDGSPEQPGATGMIYDLFVFPHARRQGVGTALMRAMLQESRQAGYLIARLMVDVDNEAAVQLYRRLGFVERRMEMYLQLGDE
jgi:ribosomal protein S18 acetylase RimI-like enzyme